MAIEVFNRHENKYLMDCDTYVKLRDGISEYMELDEYNKERETYPICNIYFDTNDSHLIRTSLNKPKYKEKLRLRSYGVPEDSDSMVFLEIKKKVCGLVNKRRSAIRLKEAYEFLKTSHIPEGKPYMNRQVLQEVRYMLERLELKPMTYLAYERRAYFGKGKHDLRVSFDTAITTRRSDLQLESGVFGESLLNPDQWLMEVKVSQSIPVWLTRLLSECKVYPTNFSKYGVEFRKTLAQKPQNKNVDCAPEPIHTKILLPA